MATQHPDNASPHPFSGKAFVPTAEEAEEAHYCFSELQCQEFMWDWEGKHVDENVVERLVESHPGFYRKHALGKDVFLTFRVPNVWKEKGYRVARAFANVIAANDYMEELGMHAPPVFELILPLTASAQQLFYLRTKYAEIVKAFEVLREPGPKDIELIPLVEEPEHMVNVGKLLREYCALCTGSPFKKFETPYLRPFLARSDPALNAGLVPAVLAAKVALSECRLFEEENGVPTHPILGAGALPFRGHLSPENVGGFAEEYKGLRTATVQSAFRADYPLATVKKAVRLLNKNLNEKAKVVEEGEKRAAEQSIRLFSQEYGARVEALAPTIQKMAAFVPARRERKLHVGLFGYSRAVGKHALPRAIAFAAALYSLGVPPEFWGMKALRRLNGREKEALLGTYSHFKKDVEAAGGWLNQRNVERLSAASPAWRQVKEDVQAAETFFGEELGPRTEPQQKHARLAGEALKELRKGGTKRLAALVEESGKLRKSLG